jgi:hypothetical protein
MYIPRNWEFGQAFSKLQNFGGGGLNPPNTPPGYASASASCLEAAVSIILFQSLFWLGYLIVSYLI